MKFYEDLLQRELDFYSGNEDRLDEDEKNKYLNIIRESTDKLSSAQMELQKKIEENPVAFREEKLVRGTKKDYLLVPFSSTEYFSLNLNNNFYKCKYIY